jgi:NAD(P)-dependent dehydrogenase (short-subunit alcohol dehydrogenase family)
MTGAEPSGARKVAWVLGGGTGIGAATARSLAGRGYTVVVSGRRGTELRRLAESETGPDNRIVALPADVAAMDGPGSVSAVHDEIASAYGPVQVLVYSAGTNVANRFWHDTTPEDFARVLDVNLTGAVRAVHAVLPGMRSRGDGLVVLVSSWAAWRFAPTAGAAYSASKGGLGVLAETLNVQERQNGIRATHLCPGEVRTDILKTRPVEPSEAEQELMLTPEDIGGTVAYLESLPPRVCVNELVITPTHNTSYTAANAASSKSTPRK